MLRHGKCDQPGCTTPEGRCIAKVLPSSGRWCVHCNGKRLREKTTEKRPSKAQQKALKKFIREADRAFSIFVRFSASDYRGKVFCVTCGAQESWCDVDCGHYEERGNFAIRYELKNCGPQCKKCNQAKGGMKEVFGQYIEQKYGAGTCKYLKSLTRSNFKIEREWLKGIIEKFTIKQPIR